MPKLNLETKTKEQEILKTYLEQNASDTLAEKINNGARICKDGITLVNKKTLSGFMEYACKEAQKVSENGAKSACIQDSVVFGWAVHYFEEDSIEGTLFNEDGTAYKPPKPAVKTTAATYTPPAPQPKPQMSLFELIQNDVSAQKQENVCSPDEEDEEPTEEELREAAEPEDQTPELPKAVQNPGSPFYQRYMRIQDQYPDHIVAFKRGDFYEALGESAKTLAQELGLTLTGRDCGFPERIPMVGFPYHSADTYIAKAIGKGLKIALAESDEEVKKLPETKPTLSPESEKHWIDDKTYVDDDGIVHEIEDDEPSYDASAFAPEALALLDEIFGNEIILR